VTIQRGKLALIPAAQEDDVGQIGGRGFERRRLFAVADDEQVRTELHESQE
jgi:hypothetical protein